MTMVAVAFVFSVCACSSDDDEPQVAVAEQVVGSYEGNEIFVVDNEESSNETKTYQFAKATDASVNMTIPEVGMGMMTIPSLSVRGIPLTKDGNTIKGRLASYEASLTGADGTEKVYTVSDLTVLFSDKKVVVAFSLKYGKMPFPFAGTFTGTKK